MMLYKDSDKLLAVIQLFSVNQNEYLNDLFLPQRSGLDTVML